MCDTRYEDDAYDDDDDEYEEVVPWVPGWQFDWYHVIKLNAGMPFDKLPDVAWQAAEEILAGEVEDWLAANYR